MYRLISLVLPPAGCTEASIMPMAPPEATDDAVLIPLPLAVPSKFPRP